MGEGWHNNHHHYQRSTNQGWHWYQIDMTYYILVMLSWVGIVRDLHRAPSHIVRGIPKPRPRAAPALRAAPTTELNRAA